MLIFTQMAKMLDVLELFLNLHGHTYMRLDGSTKPESRQIMMTVRGRGAGSRSWRGGGYGSRGHRGGYLRVGSAKMLCVDKG